MSKVGPFESPSDARAFILRAGIHIVLLSRTEAAGLLFYIRQLQDEGLLREDRAEDIIRLLTLCDQAAGRI